MAGVRRSPVTPTLGQTVRMIELLRGKVEPGENDATKWLLLFNAEYSRKLGMPVFPGTLNLRLDHPLDWLAPRYQPSIIRFGQEGYGGERDILLLPCVLASLGRRRAFLWRPIHPTLGAGIGDILEIVADVKLRDTDGLTDGILVEIELDLSSAGAVHS